MVDIFNTETQFQVYLFSGLSKFVHTNINILLKNLNRIQPQTKAKLAVIIIVIVVVVVVVALISTQSVSELSAK